MNRLRLRKAAPFRQIIKCCSLITACTLSDIDSSRPPWSSSTVDRLRSARMHLESPGTSPRFPPPCRRAITFCPLASRQVHKSHYLIDSFPARSLLFIHRPCPPRSSTFPLPADALGILNMLWLSFLCFCWRSTALFARSLYFPASQEVSDCR